MINTAFATKRVIFGIAGLILIILLVSFGTSYCNKRDKAAQARVDASQAEAAQNSAVDSIATVSARGKEETASETLTRENDQDIRAAEGASVKVNPAADSAGRRALCKRDAYKDTALCRAYARGAR